MKNRLIILAAVFLAVSAGCTKKEPAASKAASPQAAQQVTQNTKQAQGPANQSPAIQPVKEEHQTGIQGKIGSYLRKAFNIPSNVNILVKDIKPSNIKGFDKIDVEISAGGRTQSQEMYLSKDNKYLFVGRVFNINENPFKAAWSKINLHDSPAQGPANAKVTIVEYSDFECPFCGRAYSTVEDLLKKFHGKIRILYKQFPLPMHPWAMTAAIGSECAYVQNNNAFWYFYNHLFKEQGSITPDNVKAKLTGYAKAAKLNVGKFQTCLNKQETKPLVDRDMKEAANVGVSSTPTFVINGRIIQGAQPETQFANTINEILAEK